jgi:molecular chaperone Hsp33
MPGQNEEAREQFWEYAVTLGDTVKAEELLQLNNETLLYRIYHETTLRLFEPRMVRFQCRCTSTKMQQVLKVLGEKDTNELIEEKGAVEVTCDFCNTRYVFDAIDIALIFHKPKPKKT